MIPVGMQGAQQRIAAIQSRFGQPTASFAAGFARAQGAAASAAPAQGPASARSPVAAAPVAAPAGVPAASAVGATGGAGSSPATGWASGLPPQGGQWVGAMEAAAQRAGIDPRLLAALVQAESGFQADARSPAGAIGLGQLMPATARGLGVDPHDPVQNLQGAARYLRSQLDRFGSVELALAAYNAGPARVAQAGGIPRISETQQYVSRVVHTYDDLRSR